MSLLGRVVEKVKALVEGFLGGGCDARRRRLLLALMAVQRLRERGEEVTAETVAREARRIIRENPGEQWCIAEEEFTPALAADLLQELVEMGVLEPEPGLLEELGRRYRFRSYEQPGDVEEEVARLLLPVWRKLA